MAQNSVARLPPLQQIDPITLLEGLTLDPLPPSETTTTLFVPLTLKDLTTRPKKQFIIQGLLGKSDLAMIFGAPGSGKTFAIIDLIVSACCGLSFMDRYPIDNPLNVVYATNEGVDGLGQRLMASVNKFLAANSHTPIYDMVDQGLTVFEDMPQLYDPKTPFKIQNMVDQLKANGQPVDILILDTLSNATIGADENLASQMAIAMCHFKEACKALGCAGVLVHHTSKGGSYRGSSVLHGAIDLGLEVVKDEFQNRSLKIFKIKDRRKESPNEGDNFGFVLRGDDITESCYPIWDSEAERETCQVIDKKILKQQETDEKVLGVLQQLGEASQTQWANATMKALSIGNSSARQSINRLTNNRSVTVSKGTHDNANIYKLKSLDD